LGPSVGRRGAMQLKIFPRRRQELYSEMKSKGEATLTRARERCGGCEVTLLKQLRVEQLKSGF